jgi:hypothetical protein
MPVHRRSILLAFLMLGLAWLLPAAAQAQSFQRFVPFLIELDGWQGGKADGVSMQMPGNNMDTANRKYTRGSATLEAQVIVGTAAQGALAVQQSGVKIDTGDQRLSTSNMDGFLVTQTYTVKDKSGAVMVALAKNALFSLSFNGLTDEEALAIAKKFDWKGLQDTAK